MIRKMVFLFMMLGSCFSCAVMAVSNIGIIIATKGTVYAVNKDGQRLLQRGSSIFLGDMITTQNDSAAQLRLNDDTIVSVKPGTKYSVSTFNLDVKEPKNNKYVGNLVEGVLVSLSGQGKNSTHNNHALKTPVVTIAIRGTLFESGFKPNKQKQGKNLAGDKKIGEVKARSDYQKSMDISRSISWVGVSDGKVRVASRDQMFDLSARSADNNACFIRDVGLGVNISPMSREKMQVMVDLAGNNPSVLSVNSEANSAEIGGDSSVGAGRAVEKIAEMPSVSVMDEIVAEMSKESAIAEDKIAKEADGGNGDGPGPDPGPGPGPGDGPGSGDGPGAGMGGDHVGSGDKVGSDIGPG